MIQIADALKEGAHLVTKAFGAELVEAIQAAAKNPAGIELKLNLLIDRDGKLAVSIYLDGKLVRARALPFHAWWVMSFVFGSLEAQSMELLGIPLQIKFPKRPPKHPKHPQR